MKFGPGRWFIHNTLATTLKTAVHRVVKKKWDYVAVVSGIPGAGKSTLARTCAKFVCPWFDEKYIAFTYEDFVKLCDNSPENSAIVLDESFEAMNTKVSTSPQFQKIIQHLQLIRQRHLFVFLCLPNFFDLSKGIGVFRTSHLFVVYDDENGNRGKFAAYDRNAKRKLYIRGNRYLDYHAWSPNFRGKFFRNSTICNNELYDKRKLEHLRSQEASLSQKELKIPFRMFYRAITLALCAGFASNSIDKLLKSREFAPAFYLAKQVLNLAKVEKLPVRQLPQNIRVAMVTVGKHEAKLLTEIYELEERKRKKQLDEDESINQLLKTKIDSEKTIKSEGSSSKLN